MKVWLKHNRYTMIRRTGELFILAALLLVPMLSLAQETKKPNNSLLPDINPQDIEIKGDFKATFPGLRRQPILGFNPTSPIYQMSQNHVPYMEKPDEAVASLPISKLENPIAPKREFFTYPNSSRLYSQIGYGSDMSPEADAYAELHPNDKTTVLGNVHFRSTNGHYSNQNDSYRNFNFNLQWITKVSRNSRFGIGVKGMNDFNYRPGYAKKTEYGNVGLQLGYEKIKNEFNEFKTHLDYHYFRYLPHVTSIESKEHVLDMAIHKTWEGHAMNSNFLANLNVQSSMYDTPVLTNESWYIVNPEVGYQWRLGYSNRVIVKADGYYSKDLNENKFFVYPYLKYEFWQGNKLKVTARVSGKVYNKGMQGRYLQDEMLVPQMNPLNERMLTGRVDANYTLLHGMNLTGGFRYQKYYSFQYVRQDSLARYQLSRDTDTRMWRGYIGLSYNFVPEKVSFTTKFYLQNQQLSDGNDVPYMENDGITTEIAVRPVDKLYLKAWANYLGKRPKSTSGYLNSTVILGGRIEYRIMNHIGIYVSGDNLLNKKYMMWTGYKEMPLQIFGGITLKR